MGNFINIGNNNFKEARADEYVDKSMLIAAINKTLGTKRKMTCVTRCRRFGKSMAADMLCAYYDKSCDSRELFRGLEIEKDPSFEKHLNKYSVIFVSLTTFTSKFDHDPEIVKKMEQALMSDIHADFPDVEKLPQDDLMDLLSRIALAKDEKFFMIIDEWDAIIREFKDSEKVMDEYVKFLRRLFKDPITSRVFVGAYITGILPIKKYNTQSALNNFREYTMIQPGKLASYFGFTKPEVEALGRKYGVDPEELEQWYDGYRIGTEPSMFNPNSVMTAIDNGVCANYWSSTGAYDNVARYIQMNFEGLKEDIVRMIAGEECTVNYVRFNNDLKEIKSRDDVLTILIHLGYLSYNPDTRKCYIPNREVREEMESAVLATKWKELISAINSSEALLRAVLNRDEASVAAGVEKVHQDVVSIQKYNDEDNLSQVVYLAFYSAISDYIIHREYQSGKGFADLAFIPRKHGDAPALLIELKYNKSVTTALDQIRERNYPDKIREYASNIILVGINYDPHTKTHTCKIEPLRH
ncbi:MAG: ATP-binding protein [Bacteroidales bacterium]|nr:ATP-binding protein [Bacteroidales bacterium]